MEFLYVLIALAVLAVGIKFVRGNKNAEVKVETVAKPKPAPAKKVVKKAEVKKVPTKTVLNKMSKKELDVFAKDFGVTLDARKTKADMITIFQKEAKKVK